ncbi:MAG TPA: cupredoxin domain-containing protein [Candidatus Eisenbacteria bacterium]|nr:cupredoxin domain-containing protein [Candidatus Eisenbacteria bacterium]
MNHAIKGPKAAMLAALGSLLLIGVGCGATSTTTIKTPGAVVDPSVSVTTPSGVGVSVNAAGTVGAVHEVRITATQFSFEPAEVRVKQGERVKLIVESKDTTHGLAIPAFNVNMTLEANKVMTAEFTADQKGTFPFFCSVFCGSGHGGMKGSLIVE